MFGFRRRTVLGLLLAGYLDPGSGSLLVQLVLGGTAGLVVLAKMRWERLKAIVRRDAERTERLQDEA